METSRIRPFFDSRFFIDALEAYETMSTQALDSEDVRKGLKDILLGPAGLYEALRGDTGEAA